jgi:hypothetical protein
MCEIEREQGAAFFATGARPFDARDFSLTSTAVDCALFRRIDLKS